MLACSWPWVGSGEGTIVESKGGVLFCSPPCMIRSHEPHVENAQRRRRARRWFCAYMARTHTLLRYLFGQFGCFTRCLSTMNTLVYTPASSSRGGLATLLP